MKAIGINLQGPQPTATERAALEARAKSEIGARFKLKLIHAWDVGREEEVFRLDALEI